MVICTAMSLLKASAQTNGVGNPVNPAFHAIPVQNYAAVDISGASATTNVTLVTLDDANNAAYAFPTGTGANAQLNVDTWADGASTPCQTLNLTGTELLPPPGGGQSRSGQLVILSSTFSFQRPGLRSTKRSRFSTE
jgi:hypothetical protein